MTDSVNEYISQHGIEPVIKTLGRIKRNEEPFHQFAEDNNVSMDDWFEFGWMINNEISSAYAIDGVIPLVDFNYIKIQETAQQIVDSTQSIPFSELVEQVADAVESASVEDVSSWLEFAEFEENDNREITDISFSDT